MNFFFLDNFLKIESTSLKFYNIADILIYNITISSLLSVDIIDNILQISTKNSDVYKLELMDNNQLLSAKQIILNIINGSTDYIGVNGKYRELNTYYTLSGFIDTVYSGNNILRLKDKSNMSKHLLLMNTIRSTTVQNHILVISMYDRNIPLRFLTHEDAKNAKTILDTYISGNMGPGGGSGSGVITNHSQLVLNDGTNPHGTTKSDIGLDNVDNTSDINKPISNATQNALDDKVDKITGMGLSQENFTTTLKDKLDSIQNGAEVNVQSDWNQINNTLDDYIKNKPVNLSDFNNDLGFLLNETDPIFMASEASLFVLGDKNNLDNQSGINTGDETTTSIKLKRPLKTINGESLEGTGDLLINVDISNYVPYIGATQSVDLGTYSLKADSLEISTTTTDIVDVGKIVWNSQDGTFDMGLLNGVTLQAGQEIHMYAKANEDISNGDAIQFAGAQGDHLLIKKAVPSEINSNPEYFVGIATQDFTNNDFGYVTVFGQVRDLDTDVYPEGTVLYFDSTNLTSGLLTDVRPTGPSAKIIVAAVVRSHQNQGAIFVRPHVMPKIGDLQNVEITLPEEGQVLTYNETTTVWENRTIPDAPIPTLQQVTQVGNTTETDIILTSLDSNTTISASELYIETPIKYSSFSTDGLTFGDSTGDTWQTSIYTRTRTQNTDFYLEDEGGTKSIATREWTDDNKLSKSTGSTYTTNNILAVTQAEYDAIVSKDLTTLYFIVN